MTKKVYVKVCENERHAINYANKVMMKKDDRVKMVWAEHDLRMNAWTVTIIYK